MSSRRIWCSTVLDRRYRSLSGALRNCSCLPIKFDIQVFQVAGDEGHALHEFSRLPIDLNIRQIQVADGRVYVVRSVIVQVFSWNLVSRCFRSPMTRCKRCSAWFFMSSRRIWFPTVLSRRCRSLGGALMGFRWISLNSMKTRIKLRHRQPGIPEYRASEASGNCPYILC